MEYSVGVSKNGNSKIPINGRFLRKVLETGYYNEGISDKEAEKWPAFWRKRLEAKNEE